MHNSLFILFQKILVTLIIFVPFLTLLFIFARYKFNTRQVLILVSLTFCFVYFVFASYAVIFYDMKFFTFVNYLYNL